MQERLCLACIHHLHLNKASLMYHVTKAPTMQLAQRHQLHQIIRLPCSELNLTIRFKHRLQ